MLFYNIYIVVLWYIACVKERYRKRIYMKFRHMDNQFDWVEEIEVDSWSNPLVLQGNWKSFLILTSMTTHNFIGLMKSDFIVTFLLKLLMLTFSGSTLTFL